MAEHEQCQGETYEGHTVTDIEGNGRWKVQNRESGHTQRLDLSLYPELDCSSMVDDVYERSGDEQLDAYVRYVRERYAEWWEQDAVPIYWSLVPVHETAPFQRLDAERDSGRDFLTYFHWPTDRDGERLDWYRLPVVNDRFPAFAKALGWLPSPLQPTAPLRSIIASRRGAHPDSVL